MSDEPSLYKIFDDNGQCIEFLHVLPTQRVGGNGTKVDVSDADAAGVRLLQAWYNAGDNSGCEVVYGKGDILKLDQIADMRTRSSGSAGQQ